MNCPFLVKLPANYFGHSEFSIISDLHTKRNSILNNFCLISKLWAKKCQNSAILEINCSLKEPNDYSFFPYPPLICDVTALFKGVKLTF